MIVCVYDKLFEVLKNCGEVYLLFVIRYEVIVCKDFGVIFRDVVEFVVIFWYIVFLVFILFKLKGIFMW